jgi:Tol biopolymer transport system component
MRGLFLIVFLASSVAQGPATPQPPATDIYLLSLAGGIASMKDATPLPVSTAPGYDNQPMFSPDGGRVLFAANRDGRQIDIFVFERAGSRVSQLTETAENENSPTYLPAGLGDPGGFSVVRTELDKTQRLWRFDARGRDPQLVLTDIKPVGYHAWPNAEIVALFVLGPPSTLQIANVATGKAEIAADDIGRSLHRIPGTRFVSFVHREVSGEFWVKQIEIPSKKIEPLVKAVESSSERDMAWMPDGKTILMSGGTRIFSWTRGAAGWTEVFDAAPHGLGAVSRLAVSPKGDAIAIVVAEPKKG